MLRSRCAAPKRSKSLQRTAPTKRTRRPSAPLSTVVSRCSSRMPSAAQCVRSAGTTWSTSRPSNSWLPGTNSTGTGQPQNAPGRPGGVDVAGQHQQLGARGGLGVEGLGLEVKVGQQLQLHGAHCRGQSRPQPPLVWSVGAGPSGGQGLLDARHGRGQFGRQLVRQLLEQVGVQLQFLLPGGLVDADDAGELLAA
jgi:hypothetical protein